MSNYEELVKIELNTQNLVNIEPAVSGIASNVETITTQTTEINSKLAALSYDVGLADGGCLRVIEASNSLLNANVDGTRLAVIDVNANINNVNANLVLINTDTTSIVSALATMNTAIADIQTKVDAIALVIADVHDGTAHTLKVSVVP